MITKEELARERSHAVAISDDQIQTPNIPVEFLQDAGDLIPIYNQDKPELKKVKMDFAIGDRLEPAIEVLRDAQTSWMEERKDAEDARKEWKEVFPRAEALKKDILQTMRFVYDGDESALARVAEIAEGDSYSDTIQDQHDLAFRGKEDKTSFVGINYDLKHFDEAEAYSNSLMLLLGRMNGEKYSDNESKLNRDKAFTNLKKIVDYVRKYGKYVFRNDTERSVAYNVQAVGINTLEL